MSGAISLAPVRSMPGTAPRFTHVAPTSTQCVPTSRTTAKLSSVSRRRRPASPAAGSAARAEATRGKVSRWTPDRQSAVRLA